MDYFRTNQAARILGLNPNYIHKAIWDGRLEPPMKSPSGTFLWTAADIERAAWVLHKTPEFNIWQEKRNV